MCCVCVLSCKNDRAGACDLVTMSMTNFPDNIDVQHAACVAVGNLANRHAENKKRLGTAGACNKVSFFCLFSLTFFTQKAPTVRTSWGLRERVEIRKVLRTESECKM